MRYYPINLDIQGRKCLVVGGGPVATRKVGTLLSCGAGVTVVSPEASGEIRQLAAAGSVRWRPRPYESSDLGGMFLVIGATDNEELNLQIHTDAERRGKLCNIADQPKASNFIVPSIVNRGDLIVAISTSGKSPAFSKKLRRDLESYFGDEYAVFLRLMGAIRSKLLRAKHEPEVHKPLFELLIEGGLLEMIREENKDAVDALLLRILGKGYEFEKLMGQETTTAV
ncbi:MAG: bifunctional precorrin-2 dehydrogenase/sirohydrochlorin ferrochelatase [Desulfobacterales bacterium]|nr:bifunctional precorrin-2 dehydrogenase/sirohydrochlorin ferrochelatase [Desulfobacterales bacterium]